jgi:hypothetical protein
MTITLLALALLAVLAFDGIGTLFAVLGLPTSMQYADWGFPGFNAVAGLAGALLGWPIVRAQARNPIGWLLVGLGLLSAIQFAAHYYGVYGLVISPGAVPLPGLGIWLEGWLWVPTVGSVAIIMPLVFPTGRPPSPRWRPVIWLQLAAIAIPTIGYLLQPEMVASGMRAANPLIPSSLSGLAGFLVAIGMPLFVICMVIASASLIRRFRRSSGVERQQIKWLALAAAMVATVFAAYLVVLLQTGEEANILAPFAAGSFGGILLAVTIAILRHRLLDIDLLINRALVYAGVTVVLAMVYVGAVLILQGLLATFTEQRGLVVAGSTLLVAALFAPVRRRMQGAVDRRFYRSRYDAEQIVRAFAGTLRDEVDLSALTDELVNVVDQSVRPARARVWLRQTDLARD